MYCKNKLKRTKEKKKIKVINYSFFFLFIKSYNLLEEEKKTKIAIDQTQLDGVAKYCSDIERTLGIC
jgi:hypothetical protein